MITANQNLQELGGGHKEKMTKALDRQVQLKKPLCFESLIVIIAETADNLKGWLSLLWNILFKSRTSRKELSSTN
ncbi:hypothetical protein SAE01_42880 [Segetibacter aerophilus]|uniref:Uncharacterized protein n=1 Tax=Segetibacter aerophilus TaxID=670293 RepID=A0A512BII9_9BACT|nr:hypothetical protein SAE01_42880 [Segetibacter aerophilus]